MATRCNVLLTFNDTRIWLYRHWDGYPSMTGADLIEKLAACSQESGNEASALFTRFAQTLISEKRGGDSYDKDRPLYEITNCQHGDIEHLYTFAFRRSGVTVTHKHLRFDADAVACSFTPAEFAAFVNREIDATNKRIAELNKDRGAKYTPWERVKAFPTA